MGQARGAGQWEAGPGSLRWKQPAGEHTLRNVVTPGAPLSLGVQGQVPYFLRGTKSSSPQGSGQGGGAAATGALGCPGPGPGPPKGKG